MSKLPPPLNLDAVMTTARERVALVGIELEGGWKKLPEGTEVVRDGSVVFTGAGDGRNIIPPNNVSLYRAMLLQVPPLGDRDRQEVIRRLDLHDQAMAAQAATGVPKHIGEIPSPRLTIKEWATWMRRFYPHYVNATCGLHVHVSFNHALTYQRLMHPTLTSTTIEYLTRWARSQALLPDHPIWARLQGKSSYCQHVFQADAQARQKEKDHHQQRPGHRYTVWNYCYGLHSSAECRVLPMFEGVEQAISAVSEVIRIVNAFLAAGKPQREAAVSAAVEATNAGRVFMHDQLPASDGAYQEIEN